MDKDTLEAAVPGSLLNAGQIHALLRTVPNACAAPVLMVLPVSPVQEVIASAVAPLQVALVSMPVTSSQASVQRAMAHFRPSTVICSTEIFGWVSKLAFLAGSSAVFTYAEDGAGTLCDRAAHFACQDLSKERAQIVVLDAQGDMVCA